MCLLLHTPKMTSYSILERSANSKLSSYTLRSALPLLLEVSSVSLSRARVITSLKRSTLVACYFKRSTSGRSILGALDLWSLLRAPASLKRSTFGRFDTSKNSPLSTSKLLNYSTLDLWSLIRACES